MRGIDNTEVRGTVVSDSFSATSDAKGVIVSSISSTRTILSAYCSNAWYVPYTIGGDGNYRFFLIAPNSAGTGIDVGKNRTETIYYTEYVE